MRLCVYVDGFNLYYGCLKDTPYRWLNLFQLCTFLFPRDEIVSIKYFTAPIKIRDNDTDHDRPNRQQIYLRALRTISNLEIIEGTFLSHIVQMKLAHSNGYATVIKSEEKGTDVNIAAHLMNDARVGVFEKAVIISNDSDLVTPIQMVTQQYNMLVTVISPFDRNSIQLKMVASDVKKIRQGVLRASQFPEKLTDNVGEFYIPHKWKAE